jgi:hypothetical protein
MAISDLTYKVVAFAEIPDFNTDECVDWAFEMVALGYDTPSLLILAGLNRPSSYFQTIEYFNKTLAAADNIESIVKETAEQWLTKNQKHFIQAS